MIILGLDPGLANFGAAAVMVPERLVVAADVWTSKPGDGADGNVEDEDRSQADDWSRRLPLMSDWLRGLCDGWGVDAVALEAPHGLGGKPGRRQGNIAAIYAAFGGALTSLGRIPRRATVSQGGWKREVIGRKGKYTDDDLYQILRSIAGDAIEANLRRRRVRPSLGTHALDALGVALWAAKRASW